MSEQPKKSGIDLDAVFKQMQKDMSEEHERHQAMPKKYDPKAGHYIRDVPLEDQEKHFVTEKDLAPKKK